MLTHFCGLSRRRRLPRLQVRTYAGRYKMQVDAEDTAHALRVLHAREYRERAMGAPQIDIEEATGVSEAQARREAEAGGIAADRLRSLVGRIERMHEEIKALQGDVKDLYTEA